MNNLPFIFGIIGAALGMIANFGSNWNAFTWATLAGVWCVLAWGWNRLYRKGNSDP